MKKAPSRKVTAEIGIWTGKSIALPDAASGY
jgi:hypothetical protein